LAAGEDSQVKGQGNNGKEQEANRRTDHKNSGLTPKSKGSANEAVPKNVLVKLYRFGKIGSWR
jgi:hypothetical protein